MQKILRLCLGSYRNFKQLSFLIIVSLVCCVMPNFLYGQLTTAEEKGLPTNSNFHTGDIDAVNLQNGNLHISIPIASVKQRGGGTLSWSLVYDTQGWTKQWNEIPGCEGTSNGSNPAAAALSSSAANSAQPDGTTPPGGVGGSVNCNPPGFYQVHPSAVASGWRLTTPFNWTVTNTHLTGITCPTEPNLAFGEWTNFIVTDPQGTAHALPLHFEALATSLTTTGVCTGQTLEGPASDGSGMYFNSQNGILYLKNGTQIHMAEPPPNTYEYGGLENSLSDANGNEMGPNDTLNRGLVTTTTGPTTTYTTPLGVKIPGPQYTIYTVLDSSGSSQTYRIDYQAIDVSTNVCAAAQFTGATPSPYPCSDTGALGESSSSVGWPLVPLRLTLPTGKTYVFAYANNSDGELTGITLPTGGSITYSYGDFYQIKIPSTNLVGFGQPNWVGSRSVKSRTVTANGVSSTWTYKIGLGGSTVTDPLGNVTAHTFTELTANPGPAFVTSSNVYESSVSYSDASGHLLRTVSNTYADEWDPVNNAVANARVVSQTTTLDNGLVSQKQTDYETFQYSCYISEDCPATATRLNPMEVREYAYGSGSPGALTRKTDYTYLHASNAAYVTLNIVDKPATVITYNGSGTKMSETINEYDNYSHSNQPMQASNAVQHESSYGTTYTTRGNLTAISKWLNTNGALLTSTNQFDDAGNVLSTIDPLGHQTSFDYTDSWSNSACAPSGQGKEYLTKTTNALGQITTSTYNSCTGTLASNTDANRQTTSTSYDSLSRPLQVNYPDGGQTTYCYSDNESGSCYNGSALTISLTQKLNSSQNYGETFVFDGLGRQTQAQVTSDPAGVVYTDTAYDALGRVESVSNPYRSGQSGTSASSQGTTIYSYDALGRKIVQTNQDGSTQIWCYNGVSSGQSGCVANASSQTTASWVDSYDESGHHRQSVSDVLGRLVAVMEPDPTSGALSLETDYQYNVLNDLTRVDQWGGSNGSVGDRARTFSYDSLSRLLSASNPESGTMGYSYTNSGALCSGDPSLPCSKTDARGITTSYAYDALNRLTKKSYSDGVTPTALYVYDTNSITFGTTQKFTTSNVVGRLSIICMDLPGACQSMTAYSYDPMGRIIQTLNNTPTFPATEAVYTVSANYDLAGNVTSMTYPDGRVVTNTWNGAGEQQTSTFASWNGTNVSYPYLTSGIYWPNGGLEGLAYGNGTATGYHMNNRLQIDQSAAAQLTGENLYNRVYCYGPATAPLASSLPGCDALASANNGNVWEIKDALNSANTQTFNYDSLNRIKSASVGGVVQQYGIDPFGNMSITAAGSFAATFDPATNRMSNLPCAVSASLSPYDAAGDQLCDSDPNGAFRKYQYDGEGRISQITMLGSPTPFETYDYDANGDRISKSNANGSFTEYIRFGGQNLAERNSDGTWSDYIYAAGQRIAQSDTATAPTNGAASTTYYYSGPLGSTEVLTDGNGALISSSQFLPFGQEQPISGTSTNHYKFTGKERDAETSGGAPGQGLDYFGARYYNSNMGRFMTPDWAAKPISVPYASFGDPQTLNLYAYVENGPLNRVDADGHAASQDSENNWVQTVGDVPDSWLEILGGSDPNEGEPPISGNETASEQAQQQQQAQSQSSTQTPDNTLLAQNNTPAPPAGRTNSPAQGQPPDSTTVIPNPDGGTTTRRFGPDGRAVVDIDQGHGGPKHGGAPDPHAHDWDWGKKPPRQTPGRALTPEEAASVKKATFWGTVGVVTYWVVSEGSRILFPPRNLIPVP